MLACQLMKRCTNLSSTLRDPKLLNSNRHLKSPMKHSGMLNYELLCLLVVGTSYDNGHKPRNHLLDMRYVSCKHVLMTVICGCEYRSWKVE